jgi:predicted transcriptional regulator of viral defense system
MKLEKRIAGNILDSLNEKVVSKRQLVNAFRDVLQDESPETLIANLRRNKDILYVFKGYYYVLDPHEQQGSFTQYSTDEMVCVILNKLNIRWYIGLESALERNNLIWQGVVNPVILNSELSGEKKILGVKYRFHKMQREKLDFGFVKKTTKNRITFYYSDPEKTYLDYVYFRKKIPSELSAIKHNEKVKSYLTAFSKSFKKKVLYS